MKYVGGYLDYLALLEDSRAVEDVLLFMQGEGEARRIAELKARMQSGHG